MRKSRELSLELADEAATRATGGRLARAWARAPETLFVALVGELASGKTTFVRGFLAALGVQGPVHSPTYALLESYPVADGTQVHHLDWYRLDGSAEVDALGFRELLTGPAACLVEWADRVPPLAAHADLSVSLEVAGDGRRLVARSRTELGRRLAKHLPPPEKA